MNVPSLTTARLTLREVEDRDIDAIVRIVGDYEVSKWLVPVVHPYSRADAVSFVGEVQAGKHGIIWAIEHEADLIGLIGIDPELGFWLDPAHWGQGYMTEAVAAVVTYWFEATSKDTIPCAYFQGNMASAAIQRKLGFVNIGESSSHSMAQGCDVTSLKTELTRKRWSALRAEAD